MAIDPKFVVYPRGYHLDQLCLGHLVLGPWYKDPVDQTSFVCQFPRIPVQNEAAFIRSNDWSGKLLVQQGWHFALNVEALDLVQIGPALRNNQVKLLEAAQGRRVELRNPSEFLERSLLADDVVKSRIQTWLSVARTNYLFKQFVRRRPKIWMLTGLYEFQNVRTFSMSARSLSAEFGISSAVVGALGGPPVGGTFAAGTDRALTTDSFVEKPMVYAARWQLLRADYLETGSQLNPTSIALHPDNVYSIGSQMGADDEDEENDLEDADVAVVTCAEASREELLEEDDLGAEYWRAFRIAEKLMMDEE